MQGRRHGDRGLAAEAPKRLTQALSVTKVCSTMPVAPVTRPEKGTTGSVPACTTLSAEKQVRQNYAYSSAMKGAGFTWDKAKLDSFIANPEQIVPGNNMKPFSGLASADDRAKVITFLVSGTTDETK
jgi:hypothetical protein